jgi:hypothetical protein
MMVEEETFFAWLDGELGPEDAARVEAEMAADPELQRRAAEHRALAEQLRGAFEPVAQAPLPKRLEAAIRANESSVVSLAEARERRAARRMLPAWGQAAAIAATLVLGIAVGTTLNGQRGASPVEAQGGALYAAGAVDQALDRQLASAPAGDVRVGLTFREQGGAICRTFESSASSGLACREDGRWRLRGLFAAPEGASAGYRMASGGDPRLLEMVDEAIAGEPFDASREKAARDAGWK